jgi:hypothetical protein
MKPQGFPVETVPPAQTFPSFTSPHSFPHPFGRFLRYQIANRRRDHSFIKKTDRADGFHLHVDSPVVVFRNMSPGSLTEPRDMDFHSVKTDLQTILDITKVSFFDRVIANVGS